MKPSLLVAAFLLSAPFASAQDRELREQIETMKQRLSDLEKRVAPAAAPTVKVPLINT